MSEKKLEPLEPVSILMVTYKRPWFLKTIVKSIYHRTKYPYRLFVINNDAEDSETIKWLKQAKSQGYVYDFLTLPENTGLAWGFTSGFNHWKDKISERFLCTQDDIIPPLLRPICWLERLLELFKKYESEYAVISMRTQRIRRRDVQEDIELIPSPTSLASYFRIQKKNDIEKIGGFGAREHWESVCFKDKVQPLKKKLAVATHLYCDDTAFMSANKGYKGDFTDYKTYSPERVNQGELQPYPDIDEDTCIPMKINSPRDSPEHKKREEFFKLYGFDMETLILAQELKKKKDVHKSK